MPKKKNHVLSALESIGKAQEELGNRVDKHDKIIKSQGQDIAKLEKRVLSLRDQAIQAEVASGEHS